MAIVPERPAPLDISEQVARIDKMQAELQKIMAETVKIRQDTGFAPWVVLAIGLGAGAALIAAGAALAKLLMG